MERFTPKLMGGRDQFITSFDKLFDEMMKNSFPDFSQEMGINFFEKSAYPKVNVIDKKDSIEIIAEIPGLKKSEIEIEIDGDILTISGKKKESKEDENTIFIRRELKSSSFKRSFKLGKELSREGKVKFEDGILTINVPKIKEALQTAKKLEIE